MNRLILLIKTLGRLTKLSTASLAWFIQNSHNINRLTAGKHYPAELNKTPDDASIRTAALIGNLWRFSHCRRFAIYGAGQHTAWLEKTTSNHQDINIVAVLDDTPDSKPHYWGLKPQTPEEWDPQEADAIILSSDCHQNDMQKRCKSLFGDSIKIINLYEGLPPGPYRK